MFSFLVLFHQYSLNTTRTPIKATFKVLVSGVCFVVQHEKKASKLKKMNFNVAIGPVFLNY